MNIFNWTPQYAVGSGRAISSPISWPSRSSAWNTPKPCAAPAWTPSCRSCTPGGRKRAPDKEWQGRLCLAGLRRVAQRALPGAGQPGPVRCRLPDRTAGHHRTVPDQRLLARREDPCGRADYATRIPNIIPEAACFDKPLAKWSYDFTSPADSVRKTPIHLDAARGGRQLLADRAHHRPARTPRAQPALYPRGANSRDRRRRCRRAPSCCWAATRRRPPFSNRAWVANDEQHGGSDSRPSTSWSSGTPTKLTEAEKAARRRALRLRRRRGQNRGAGGDQNGAGRRSATWLSPAASRARLARFPIRRRPTAGRHYARHADHAGMASPAGGPRRPACAGRQAVEYHGEGETAVVDLSHGLDRRRGSARRHRHR